MKTYSAKPSEVTRKWYIVDASTVPLGRLSTVIASRLTGKHKPMYTAHIDCGDHVIVINADKLVVTGNKLKDKIYYSYSGYPGGMKSSTLSDKITKDSTTVIRAAVKGMLPRNKLTTQRLARLRVFAGAEHGHTAQQPEVLDLRQSKTAKGELHG